MNIESEEVGRSIVVVKINGQTSSLRTRNRVKQNGPLFVLINDSTKNSKRLDQVLLQSITTNWFGWLKTSEIIISPNMKTDWKDYGNNKSW